MKTLQIEDKEARKLFPVASPEMKAVLVSTFGADFFSVKITDRIKTYEDACAETGETPVDESKMKAAGFTQDEIDYRKLKTVTKALVGDWKADWSDDDQKKWYPWFRLSPAGFVFAVTYFSCSDAFASYASRLCFPSDELATYAGKQFIELYKSFIL